MEFESEASLLVETHQFRIARCRASVIWVPIRDGRVLWVDFICYGWNCSDCRPVMTKQQMRVVEAIVQDGPATILHLQNVDSEDSAVGPGPHTFGLKPFSQVQRLLQRQGYRVAGRIPRAMIPFVPDLLATEPYWLQRRWERYRNPGKFFEGANGIEVMVLLARRFQWYFAINSYFPGVAGLLVLSTIILPGDWYPRLVRYSRVSGLEVLDSGEALDRVRMWFDSELIIGARIPYGLQKFGAVPKKLVRERHREKSERGGGPPDPEGLAGLGVRPPRDHIPDVTTESLERYFRESGVGTDRWGATKLVSDHPGNPSFSEMLRHLARATEQDLEQLKSEPGEGNEAGYLA